MTNLLFIFDAKTSELIGYLVFESDSYPEPIQTGLSSVWRVRNYTKTEGTLNLHHKWGKLTLDVEKCIRESGKSPEEVQKPCVVLFAPFDPKEEDVQERIQKEMQETQEFLAAQAEYEERTRWVLELVHDLLELY